MKNSGLDGLSDCSSSEDDFSESLAVKFKLPENRSRHETDSKCSVCRINFNIPGVAHTEKGLCKFCYRGVCKHCLTSSKSHPETLSKEKICRSCVKEFKEIRFYSQSIQDSRLEIQQLQMELQLANKEHQTVAYERKVVQDAVCSARDVKVSTHLQREETIEVLKERLSSLNVRHDLSEEKMAEMLARVKKLNKSFDDKRLELGEIKKLSTEKDDSDEKIKRRITRYKEKTLQLLDVGRENEETVEKAEGSVAKLRRRVKRYQTKIENKEEEIEINSIKFEELQKQIFENQQRIDELTDRVKKISNQPENQDYSQEEFIKISEANENLAQYDEIISKLEERLQNIKKNRAKSLYLTNDNLEKKYKQCEILANISHMQKRNSPQKDKTGNASCQKCIIH